MNTDPYAEPQMEDEYEKIRRRREIAQQLQQQQLQQSMQANGAPQGGTPPLGLINQFMPASGGAAGASGGGGFTGAGVHGMMGGGGAAGGGAGGSSGLAAAGPWAALAAAIIGNETYAKKHGYRNSGSEYWTDLATGKVLGQDIDQRVPGSLKGDNALGLGSELNAISALSQGHPKDFASSLVTPLEKIWKLF